MLWAFLTWPDGHTEYFSAPCGCDRCREAIMKAIGKRALALEEEHPSDMGALIEGHWRIVE